MGQPRGAKPKPTILKRLAGNPGKRKLNDNEPQPKIGLIKPPKFLLPGAKKQWEKMGPELIRMSLLAEIDSPLFAVFCQSIGRFEEVEGLLNAIRIKIKEEKGELSGALAYYLHKTQGGNTVVNQLLGVAHREADLINKIAPQFAIGVSNRSRINIEPKKEQDKFEKFLEEGLTVVK